MSWLNNDGLLLKYGTEKTIPNVGGEFCMPGESRMIEFDIDVSKLTTTASVITGTDTVFMPANVFVDSVTTEALTACATITSFSIGTVQMDRSTNISDTSLIAAQVLSTVDAGGETTVTTGGTTYAGTTVGTTTGANPGYFTAKIAGSAGTGKIRVRVRYHGVTPITQ